MGRKIANFFYRWLLNIVHAYYSMRKKSKSINKYEAHSILDWKWVDNLQKWKERNGMEHFIFIIIINFSEINERTNKKKKK